MAKAEIAPQETPESMPDEFVAPDESVSSGTICHLSGSTLFLWSVGDTSRAPQSVCELRLAPDAPVVVGRYEGREVPYLDPAYRPTNLMPGSGEPILNDNGDGSDGRVSRGHFMLRAAARGILFVNGVPRRGGGIRPPLNGTWQLEPERRLMTPEEEYLIESGRALVVCLPNGSQLRVVAA